MVRTADGKLHEDERAAMRLAEARYADRLSRVADGLVAQNGKHVATGNWVDANLAAFLELAELKRDTEMENGRPEDLG
jgi:hypothetical protein